MISPSQPGRQQVHKNLSLARTELASPFKEWCARGCLCSHHLPSQERTHNFSKVPLRVRNNRKLNPIGHGEGGLLLGVQIASSFARETTELQLHDVMFVDLTKTERTSFITQTDGCYIPGIKKFVDSIFYVGHDSFQRMRRSVKQVSSESRDCKRRKKKKQGKM
uniref:Uncharacterized protein n=1 Tax=Timema poppense TaxID=170557 RepID=A0A7R9GYF8_TIMPO|nr:unnamed protein product [Timema poppensis]